MHLSQAKFLSCNQPTTRNYIAYSTSYSAWNAEIPCLCASFQKLAKCDIILPAEIGAIKQRRFLGQILEQ